MDLAYAESEDVPIMAPKALKCFREDCFGLKELRLPYLHVHVDLPGPFTHVLVAIDTPGY